MPRLDIMPVQNDLFHCFPWIQERGCAAPLGVSPQAARKALPLQSDTVCELTTCAGAALQMENHGPISRHSAFRVFSPTGFAAIPKALFSYETPRVLGIRHDLDSYTNKKSNR
jgi:hypothetical protein